MPARGAPILVEQLATLTRLRHELLAGDRLGRLIDAAGSELGSQPHDSFDASLIRVAHREWEGAPVPASCARRRPGSPRSPSMPGTRPRAVRLHRLPAPPRAGDRAPAPVRRVASKPTIPTTRCSTTTSPMRTAELRPVLEALRDGGAPGESARSARARPRSTTRACTGVRPPRPGGAGAGGRRIAAARDRCLAPRSDRASVRGRDRDLGPRESRLASTPPTSEPGSGR